MDEEILENEEKEVIEEQIPPQDAENMQITAKNDEETEISPSEPNEAEPRAEEQGTEITASNKEEDEISALRAELQAERQKRIESESRIRAIDILEKRGLPRSLYEIISSQSDDEMEKRADTISEIIKDTVNSEIAKRLSTIPAPTKGGELLCKGAVKKMSLDEMQRLYKSDRALYRELIGK
jgi:hypothetical protein